MFFKFFSKRGRRGQVLILGYVIIAVLVVMTVGLLYKSVNERNLALRSRLTQEAFYLAEGGIEDAISQFSAAIANFVISPAIETYNVTTNYSTFSGAVANSVLTRLEDTDRLLIENGTNVLVRNYEISSTVIHPQNNSIVCTVHQILGRRLIPTFQHAVFYNLDLEMLPGPNMTLTGRIHCNNDVYVDSENTFTIDSFYFRSVGDIFNQRKDSGQEVAGDVRIRKDKPGNPQYEYMSNLDCDNPGWATEAINRWAGTVQSAVHGVTELTAPSVGSIQAGGYYQSQAKVVIVNNQITKNGVILQEGVDYPVGTVTATSTLYNNREGTYVKTTNLDLKKLAGYATGDPEGAPSFPNNLPSNGLLYATRDDAGFIYEPGIRLVNASQIYKDSGLTVTSNDPVYIQGNYNTVNEKPAAVICDSLNLLSNNWNDANSTLNVNSRVANATTYNCAFIAGIDNTTTGHYNGGLENYPRLHENWTSKTLTIKGSFVALWNCQIAHGAWVYGNPQYTAPNRNWQYNTAFNDTSKLPPFTPWAVEIQRLAWWKE